MICRTAWVNKQSSCAIIHLGLYLTTGIVSCDSGNCMHRSAIWCWTNFCCVCPDALLFKHFWLPIGQRAYKFLESSASQLTPHSLTSLSHAVPLESVSRKKFIWSKRSTLYRAFFLFLTRDSFFEFFQSDWHLVLIKKLDGHDIL